MHDDVLEATAIDELARFLWFGRRLLDSTRDSFPFYATTALCNENAGITAAAPETDKALRLIEKLKLGQRHGDSVKLTSGGKQVLEHSSSPLDLNEEQRDILIGLISHDARLRELLALFRTERTKTGRGYRLRVEVGGIGEEPNLVHFFTKLGLLFQDEDEIFFNENKVTLLHPVNIGRLPLTPDMFERILQTQRAIGEAGEEYAVRWEQARLKATHKPELASLVLHVSKHDVSKGYDILSVDGGDDGEKSRFIEVKSSSGAVPDFYVSQNEVSVGRELGEQYWIYFIPSVTLKMPTATHPLLFRDPFGEGKSVLSREPQGYHVQLKEEPTVSQSTIRVDQLPTGTWISHEVPSSEPASP